MRQVTRNNQRASRTCALWLALCVIAFWFSSRPSAITNAPSLLAVPGVVAGVPFSTTAYSCANLTKRPNETVVALIEGNPWFLHANDAITTAVLKHGGFEFELAKYIEEAFDASQDGIFVDIGANVGILTRVVLAAGRDVIAVEALPDNARLLHCSAYMNRWSNTLTVYNVPLTEPGVHDTYCVCRPLGNPSDGILVPREKVLSETDPLRATHPLLCGTSDSQPEKNHCAEELVAITLDELKIKRPIAIMKLDVEGMECVALKGAASTLKTSRPCTILAEFNPGLQKFSTCSIFDMAEYMAGEDYFPHAWEGMDGCSNAVVTYDGLAARDVPGELHNLCWKPKIMPAHCKR